MKKQKLFKQSITVIMAFMGIGLFAQDPIILSPKDLIPADTGYYIGGAWKDENKDGVDEFYNGCFDAYGDANHNESGTQQGFYYYHAMIMPTCWPKDAVDDNSLSQVTQGYIELGKSKYTSSYGEEKDTSHFCYIITPAITNLDSMVIEASPDVTPLPNRHIYWDMEYSAVNDTVWSGTKGLFIQDETTSKLGDIHHYSAIADNFSLEFEEFITASKTEPIIIRILSTDQTGCIPTCVGSCRVKIHSIKIYASLAATAVKPVTTKQPVIHVVNNVITSTSGKVFVYNYLGQCLGYGESVAVPAGVYLVKHTSGNSQKIVVE